MGLNMTGPACPKCGTLITRVVSTVKDQAGEHFVRRRHCQSCDHRFYTAQTVEVLTPQVQWIKVRRKSIPVLDPWREDP
jgi:transcriptional regulator NrdR family protein